MLADEFNRLAEIKKKTEPLRAPASRLPSGDFEERLIRSITFEDED
jgi:hypothetical protein